MSINKNKSEIVESFKNLLKKADEVKGLNENMNETENIYVAKKVKLVKIDSDIKSRSVNNLERLGIKNIKRVPNNPFQKKYKEENKEQFEKYESEASIKIANILNKHIYHWLNREMPKFSRIKLRKHIYSLLSELAK